MTAHATTCECGECILAALAKDQFDWLSILDKLRARRWASSEQNASPEDTTK